LLYRVNELRRFISVGAVQEKVYVHNHLTFNVLHNVDKATGRSRVVGFEVKPLSVKHAYAGSLKSGVTPSAVKTCSAGGMPSVGQESEAQEVKAGEEIVFTYDVVFLVRSRPCCIHMLVKRLALGLAPCIAPVERRAHDDVAQRRA
jgi:hypothetical protein